MAQYYCSTCDTISDREVCRDCGTTSDELCNTCQEILDNCDCEITK